MHLVGAKSCLAAKDKNKNAFQGDMVPEDTKQLKENGFVRAVRAVPFVYVLEHCAFLDAKVWEVREYRERLHCPCFAALLLHGCIGSFGEWGDIRMLFSEKRSQERAKK